MNNIVKYKSPGIDVKNYLFPTINAGDQRGSDSGMRTKDVRDLNRYALPVQFQRLRQDTGTWREGIIEAELSYYPFRVKMQQCFIDTINNEHVFSCWKKRKALTLLKDFVIVNSAGNINEKATKLFKDKRWFNYLLHYILDAEAFGYSLIGFGDLIDNGFPNIKVLKRWLVSPDRNQYVSMLRSLSGINFLDPDAKDEHGKSFVDYTAWIPTMNDIGTSPCGYGLLYKVAMSEIFIRNNMSYNADFVEMFAMPYRVGTTDTRDEISRANMEGALRSMGSAGYAVVDPGDEIKFIESQLGGTGYKAYDSFNLTHEKLITKVLLGHPDAMGSVAGKKGGDQGGETSTVSAALEVIEKEDNSLALIHLNDIILPKLRNLGFLVGEDEYFAIKNDKELFEGRVREDEANQKTALVVKALKDAGLTVDAEYITNRTGIPVEQIPIVPPIFPKSPGFSEAMKNKLNETYK